jgi:hypothetical protein
VALYREQYFDLNVRHFHEKLREEHQIEASTTLPSSKLAFKCRLRSVAVRLCAAPPEIWI